MTSFAEPSNQQQLLTTLAPLPISGRSWPRGIAALAWAFIALIMGWALLRAPQWSDAVPQPVLLSLLICFLGLCVIAYYMGLGQTRITTQGIEQDWIFQRTISWDEIRMAKFVPLLFSKRLICFPHRGRPVIFHGGERAVEIAFAHIALAYARPAG